MTHGESAPPTLDKLDEAPCLGLHLDPHRDIMAVLKSLKSKLSRKSSMEATKIPIIPNPNYRRCGTKSYLHLMRKYRFNPTKPGPYCLATTVLQTGRPYTNKPIGGRAHARQILQKRNADTNRIGQVDADDVQNDARYLARVGIGTPAQVLSLDFDTASADLLLLYNTSFII